MKQTAVFLMFLLMGWSGFAQISAYPVLLVATSSSFGTYTGEILKAEGWNEFRDGFTR